MRIEQKNPRGVRLNVKLVPGTDQRQITEIFSNTPGVQSAIQTFPDETDEELANLYILEVDPSNLKAALRKLHHNPYVEYAEETARRKLIW
jgi:hypothetical protein